MPTIQAGESSDYASELETRLRILVGAADELIDQLHDIPQLRGNDTFTRFRLLVDTNRSLLTPKE